MKNCVWCQKPGGVQNRDLLREAIRVGVLGKNDKETGFIHSEKCARELSNAVMIHKTHYGQA